MEGVAAGTTGTRQPAFKLADGRAALLPTGAVGKHADALGRKNSFQEALQLVFTLLVPVAYLILHGSQMIPIACSPLFLGPVTVL